MPKVYDDWERLVRAAVRKQELWQLFHDHSRTPSGGSTASGTSGSPASASPKTVRSRVSPLISSHTVAAEVLPSSSTTRASPVTPNDEQKQQMKRRKSRLRLDRWIFTRWLSKTFHSTSP